MRPGEISLAHNGVLFLDELLEFSRPVLETLRQPLEERSIPGESSSTVRARVEAAHTRQRARDPRSNATLPTRALAEVVQLDTEADRLLERAVERLALSARAIDRVRRVARTIADLEGSPGVGADHLAEALQYRLLDRPDP